MSNTFDKKRLGLAVACALALGVLSATAHGQVQDEHALVTSSSGAPVMSGFGLCVRSGFGPAPEWTFAWIHGCDDYAPVEVGQWFAPALAWEIVTFDANVLFDSDKSIIEVSGTRLVK